MCYKYFMKKDSLVISSGLRASRGCARKVAASVFKAGEKPFLRP